MAILRREGFSLIEIVIVVTIISVLILGAIWAFQQQLAKGRDGRRKADLAKIQKMFEDYLNDNDCYSSDFLVCGSTAGTEFEDYLAEIPCDPVNDSYYHYMYTYDVNANCPKWYKIYTKLESESDPIIAQVGCANGCGPSDNYSYWASSPNVTDVDPLDGEFWPPVPLPPLETDPTCQTCSPDCTPDSSLYPNCCGACCDGNYYRCDQSINKCLYDPGCLER